MPPADRPAPASPEPGSERPASIPYRVAQLGDCKVARRVVGGRIVTAVAQLRLGERGAELALYLDDRLITDAEALSLTLRFE